MATRRLKTPPRQPKTASRWFQDAIPRRAKTGPRQPQDGSKWSKMAPRQPSKTPLRRPKMAPKWCQDDGDDGNDGGDAADSDGDRLFFLCGMWCLMQSIKNNTNNSDDNTESSDQICHMTQLLSIVRQNSAANVHGFMLYLAFAKILKRRLLGSHFAYLARSFPIPLHCLRITSIHPMFVDCPISICLILPELYLSGAKSNAAVRLT